MGSLKIYDFLFVGTSTTSPFTYDYYRSYLCEKKGGNFVSTFFSHPVPCPKTTAVKFPAKAVPMVGARRRTLEVDLHGACQISTTNA